MMLFSCTFIVDPVTSHLARSLALVLLPILIPLIIPSPMPPAFC